MFGYYIIAGIIFLVSWYVSHKLKSKFKEYSKIHLQNGMSGKEIAEKMLADNGITDVQVISVPGQLTDHYDPSKKTVNLSEPVYMQRNAAAAAVAAHECGHAVQHATAYSWLKLRSTIVPAVSVSSKLSNFVIMAGIILFATGSAIGTWVFGVGILLFAVTTAFAFITLPVEFDASKRALVWLESYNFFSPLFHPSANFPLNFSSPSYFFPSLRSFSTLLYFLPP